MKLASNHIWHSADSRRCQIRERKYFFALLKFPYLSEATYPCTGEGVPLWARCMLINGVFYWSSMSRLALEPYDIHYVFWDWNHLGRFELFYAGKRRRQLNKRYRWSLTLSNWLIQPKIFETCNEKEVPFFLNNANDLLFVAMPMQEHFDSFITRKPTCDCMLHLWHTYDIYEIAIQIRWFRDFSLSSGKKSTSGYIPEENHSRSYHVRTKNSKHLAIVKNNVHSRYTTIRKNCLWCNLQ